MRCMSCEVTAAWPTLPLIGQAYMGYLNLDAPQADFVVYDAGSWIYTGTGLHNGSALAGIIGSDSTTSPPPGHPPTFRYSATHRSTWPTDSPAAGPGTATATPT